MGVAYPCLLFVSCFRERKDPKDLPVEMVFRDPWVCQAPEDHPDPRARMETRWVDRDHLRSWF